MRNHEKRMRLLKHSVSKQQKKVLNVSFQASELSINTADRQHEPERICLYNSYGTYKNFQNLKGKVIVSLLEGPVFS